MHQILALFVDSRVVFNRGNRLPTFGVILAVIQLDLTAKFVKIEYTNAIRFLIPICTNLSTHPSLALKSQFVEDESYDKNAFFSDVDASVRSDQIHITIVSFSLAKQFMGVT